MSAALKTWVNSESIRLFALVEISKRGKVGVVMTSATSARALVSMRNRLTIDARGGQTYEVWTFVRES